MDRNLISFLDFPHVCRFCLSRRNLKPLELHQYILNLFKTLTNIVVLQQDDLPSNICSQCIQTLENIMDFIYLAENNDANLRQTLVNKNDAKLEYEKMVIRGPETEVVPFQNFAYICRFCLSREDLDTFKENQYLLNIARNILQIEVKLDDHLPQNVCLCCIQKLEDISNFIKSSKNNDTDLRQVTIIIKDEPYCDKTEAITILEKENCGFIKKLKTERNEVLDIALDKGIENEILPVELVCNSVEQEGQKSYADISADHVKTEGQSGCIEEDNFFIKEEKIEAFLHEEVKIEEEVNVSEECNQLKAIIDHQEGKNEDPRPYHCTSCPKTYAHESQLVIHYRTHTGERPFRCTVCEQRFARSSNLSVHMKSHGEHENAYACESCDETFARKPQLDHHMRAHTGETKFRCETCLKSYANKQNLLTHMNLHTGERPFKCPECQQGFSRKSHLEVHIKMHKGENPFQCKSCSKNFYSVYSLTRHESKRACGKSLECTLCSRKYVRAKDLEAHARLHSGVKPFQCQFCPRSFYRKCLLNDHLKFHKPDKLYPCEFCERSFPHKGTLNRHLMSHTGEKPFSCAHCPKKFRMKDDWTAHERKQHEGVRPYECDACGAAFDTKLTWRAHKKTHTAERPFGCHICSKCFATAAELEEHVSWHLQGKKSQEAGA